NGFFWIVSQIEELRAARFQFVNEFPTTVPQPEQSQRVIGEKKGQLFFLVQKRFALVVRWPCYSQQIENGRGHVDQAGAARDADRRLDQSRRCDHARHAHVFVVNEKGV